jgi:hypothetical protein
MDILIEKLSKPDSRDFNENLHSAYYASIQSALQILSH